MSTSLPPTGPPSEPPDRSSLVLDEQQREVLLEELRRFDGLGGGQASLLRALESGTVPAAEHELFTVFLEGVLESGGVRHRHGPGTEASLLTLYRQTRRGRSVAAAVADANRALSALAGQQLVQLAFRSTLPGAFQLAVETNRCHIRLEIDRRGVGAKDVAVTA